MGEKLLITGGVLRENGFELGEGKYYGCASLLCLDTGSGTVDQLLAVHEGNENFPDVHPNLEFTVGDVEGDKLWLATDTEIRLYQYPSLALLKTFSHPCFHNIHAVAVRGDELYVTSTGLDMVVVLNKQDGSILKYLNAEGKLTWHRFSPDTDYRKLHSTRPHDSHPNYVFWIDDEPWVTRCTQEDAVSLSDTRRRIDISGPRKPISVHDGIVRGGQVFFTTVDGSIVIADTKTLQPVETIQITAMEGYGGLRGWCRGLYFSGGLAYVGFSRLRKTRRTEKVEWIKSLLKRGEMVEECSVLAIDLKRKKILADYRIPAGTIDAIYSIFPEPVHALHMQR
ncbi:MAG: hypothetical protein HY938_09045 [Nitrosomonadales bacterium]|nr:hypothetical protein [Nitrosomonadales bacterium]